MSLNHLIPGLSPTNFLGTVLSDALAEETLQINTVYK
jgi:hypothetical protein